MLLYLLEEVLTKKERKECFSGIQSIDRSGEDMSAEDCLNIMCSIEHEAERKQEVELD